MGDVSAGVAPKYHPRGSDQGRITRVASVLADDNPRPRPIYNGVRRLCLFCAPSCRSAMPGMVSCRETRRNPGPSTGIHRASGDACFWEEVAGTASPRSPLHDRPVFPNESLECGRPGLPG